MQMVSPTVDTLPVWVLRLLTKNSHMPTAIRMEGREESTTPTTELLSKTSIMG